MGRALLAVLLLAACTNPRPTEPSGTETDDRTVALDPASLAGGERLAVVHDGRLHVLERGEDPVEVGGAEVTSPRWSPDGEWLAYLEGEGQEGRLARLVAEGGTAPRDAAGLPRGVRELRWSPRGDRFAATVEEAGGPSLWVGGPETAARRVATAGDGIFSFAWRPDGDALAYVATAPEAPPRADSLLVLPLAGDMAGTPSEVFTAGPDEGRDVAGWWPDGTGLLFWVNPQHAASLAADGLRLHSLAEGSRRPEALTGTLVYPEWISWADDRRVLLVAGFGRDAWKSKVLAYCHAGSGGCQNLPAPEGTVALDPALPPDGTQGGRIAFVRAAEADGADPGAWAASRTLWTANPDGSGGQEVPGAGTGVFGPRWDREGERILYAGGGALRIVRADGDGPPSTVVEPFPGPDGEPLGEGTPSYYGHLALGELVDWWRGP